jgi:formate dehydrogenase beta subunit
MLGIGATCGIILSVASKVFYVYEDPRIAEVEVLPGRRQLRWLRLTPGAPRRPWRLSPARPPGVCVVAGPEAAIRIAASWVSIPAAPSP